MWCNVGFSNNDLTGIKLLCKQTSNFSSWNIPLRTYDFISSNEYLYNNLNSDELSIYSSKNYYTADSRNVHLYSDIENYNKNRKNGNIINRKTLEIYFQSTESTYATCILKDKKTDLKKILENELELIKEKIVEENKI